jgi:AmiR/NasT family two-component response regulator
MAAAHSQTRPLSRIAISPGSGIDGAVRQGRRPRWIASIRWPFRRSRVAVATSHELKVQQLSERVEHLEAAIKQRETIGRAEGILMAIHEIKADVARSMLAYWAQRDGVTVYDMAQTLIAAEPTRRTPH